MTLRAFRVAMGATALLCPALTNAQDASEDGTQASALPLAKPAATPGVASASAYVMSSPSRYANETPAESPTPVSSDDVISDMSNWQVSFTPYAWLAGIEGDVTIPRGGNRVGVDQSFSEILDNLKFTFMGTLDIEHRRVVGIVDVIYLDVGVKADEFESPLIDEAKLDSKTFAVTGAIGYRLVDKGPLFVDLVAGVRYVSLDVDLKVVSPLGTLTPSASPSGVAPIVGGRVRIPLGRRWGMAVYGDAGINSDVKWQLSGTLRYDIARHWYAAAGYRHMAVTSEGDRGKLDVSLSGPVIGVGYRF